MDFFIGRQLPRLFSLPAVVESGFYEQLSEIKANPVPFKLPTPTMAVPFMFSDLCPYLTGGEELVYLYCNVFASSDVLFCHAQPNLERDNFGFGWEGMISN